MNIHPSGATLPPSGNPSVASPVRDANLRLVAETPASKTPNAATVAQRVQPSDRQQVEAATQSVREFVQKINSTLEFTVDEDSGRLLVKIIDSKTKEVIRQMPSEEMLAIAKALDSLKGLFVKQTA